MAISEEQLATWSHQGSVAQSATTYQAVRSVLNDPSSPYAAQTYNIFLQGSYGNDTNIYADSDVDVTICLSSIYYRDTSRLNPDELARYEKSNPGSATYTFDRFKSEVFAWLVKNFGAGVKAGKKAIFIPGNGTRRDADVLVCVNHRLYWSFAPNTSGSYSEGICFWTTEGIKIVNFPKQHRENCTTKHQNTSSRYKPNVRILKNMRNAMIAKGFLSEGIAPSYYIEGMLSNVPDNHFVGKYQETFEYCSSWLDTCDTEALLCANKIHFLLRDGKQVCWSNANYNTFRLALRKFWNSSKPT